MQAMQGPPGYGPVMVLSKFRMKWLQVSNKMTITLLEYCSGFRNIEIGYREEWPLL